MKLRYKLLKKIFSSLTLSLTLFSLAALPTLQTLSFLENVRQRQEVSAQTVWPGSTWETSTPADMGMDDTLLNQARDYALTGGGSGYITKGGKLVKSWGDPDTRYDLKSTTKSIGITALGLAVKDGTLSLSDLANDKHSSFGVPPTSNIDTGWLPGITLKELATHTAGFDKPGGYHSLLFDSGNQWFYSDGGANWLAEVTTLAHGADLNDVLFTRVFTPLGIDTNDLTWRDNLYRDDTISGIKNREFGSGISANVDALARIGYLYLRQGEWNGQQILPTNFIDQLRTSQPELAGLPEYDPNIGFNASEHYGLLWWNNADKTMANVPSDAYWSWGLGDSLIVVIPSLDIVASRAGGGWRSGWTPDYSVAEPFIEPIVQSVTSIDPSFQIESISATPSTISDNQTSQLSVQAGYPNTTFSANQPYPTSEYVTGFTWGNDITRQALGSDVWPVTWADDGNIYTTFSDGWGFDPGSPIKLSTGFAKILGDPTSGITGENIPSSTGEETGNGASGKKASSILMVDGRLYIWLRNANLAGEQSQLAWSDDYAQTWTHSTWVFEEFGYPTFANYGQNYQGAFDNGTYVYVYTADTPSAYNETDTVALMRVLRNQVTDQSAYEFFAGLDNQGNPNWVADITQRAPIFQFPGGVNRLSVSYNAPLDRYFMTMRSQGFVGGHDQFSIYESPNLWGPWQTVYYSENTDANWLGESQHIPTKWLSADGKTAYLIHSGNDAFNVKEMTLQTSGSGNISYHWSIISGQGTLDNANIPNPIFTPADIVGQEIVTLKAESYDDNNYASQKITITVNDANNQNPNITLTSPINGNEYTIGENVLIEATADDPDGTVSKVEFYQDTTLLGEDTTSPYSFTWTPETEGTYALSAKAIDDDNGQTTSSPSNVTINPASGGTGGDGAFIESAGQVIFEAENFGENISRNGFDWVEATAQSGFSGESYMESLPNQGTNNDTNYQTLSPEMTYSVDITNTGTYYIWVRGWGVTGSDDSIHLGINNQEVQTARRFQLNRNVGFYWTSQMMNGDRATLDITSTGANLINLWMREDGSKVDKIILTTDGNYTPSGEGPAESPRLGASPTPTPTLTLTPTPTPTQSVSPTASPTPAPGSGRIWIDAHTGNLGGDMTTSTDYNQGAINTNLVYTNNTYWNTNNSSQADYAEFSVDIPESGAWYAWGRFYYPGVTAQPTNDPNSFWISIDGGSAYVLGNRTDIDNTWHWDNNEGQPISLGTLSAGTHTLKVWNREAKETTTEKLSPRLDMLLLTKDSAYIPNDNDINSPDPTPTFTPTPSPSPTPTPTLTPTPTPEPTATPTPTLTPSPSPSLTPTSTPTPTPEPTVSPTLTPIPTASPTPTPTSTPTPTPQPVVEEVVILPGSGTYTQDVTVNMSTNTADASIYYTLDGTDPTESSTSYTQAFVVSTDTTIKAKAFKTNYQESNITSVSYTFVTTPPDWWDINWTKRQLLNISNPSTSENLTDFPILIKLDTSRINYADFMSQGEDIRFIDTNGALLSYEIENWDIAGDSYIWVEIPSLSAGTVANIWMYYANPQAIDAQSGVDTWSDNYAGVWHLAEIGPSGEVYDETSNNISNAINAPTKDAGFLGDALYFSGADQQYVDVPDNPSITNIDHLTYSAWVYPTSAGNREILSKARSSREFRLAGTSTDMYLRGCIQNDSPTCSNSVSGAITLNTWQYVTMTYADTGDRKVHLFINGQEVTYQSQETASGSFGGDLDRNFNIGRRSSGDRYFEGLLDEVRIESQARSAEWINAQYMSMTDQIVSYSTPESL